MQLGLRTKRTSQRCRDSYSDHMLRRAVQSVTLCEGFLRKVTEICRAPSSVRNFYLHLPADRDPGRPHLCPIPNLGEPPVRPYRGSRRGRIHCARHVARLAPDCADLLPTIDVPSCADVVLEIVS